MLVIARLNNRDGTCAFKLLTGRELRNGVFVARSGHGAEIRRGCGIDLSFAALETAREEEQEEEKE